MKILNIEENEFPIKKETLINEIINRATIICKEDSSSDVSEKEEKASNLLINLREKKIRTDKILTDSVNLIENIKNKTNELKLKNNELKNSIMKRLEKES